MGSNVMALLIAGWLLLILLVNMPNDVAAADPRFEPKCHIPCEDNNCWLPRIHCFWDQAFDPQVPANYSLHWKRVHSEEGHVKTGASLSGFIDRVHFSMNSELRVWVKAESQRGSAKSQEVVFNTGYIVKPAAPKITWSQQDPLELSWNSTCNEAHLSLGSCDVRFRTEANKMWLEEEIGAQVNYEFSDAVQPGVFYEFQVRCSCATGLMSDWSASHRIRSSERAPTGEMDVWKDCGVPATNIDCVITWKKLPIFQANGHILGYEVTLLSKHSTAVSVNISTAEPRGRLVCNEMQCYLNSSLTSVSSVNISAYNAQGATEPSYLAIPTPDKERNEQAIDVRMNTENLSVSWDLHSQLPDINSFKEYVVQYKQAGRRLGQGFSWMRVNESRALVTFRGHFEKSTPYQVSLFKVTHNGQSQHVSSVIEYSHQGTPLKVPSFKVTSIAATHVTLFWESGPLTMQKGHILCYQIGVHGQKLYNVTYSPRNTSHTFELLDLNPDQEYEVWIKAVTKAGPGPNVIARFKTKQQEHLHLQSHILTLLPLVCLLVMLGCLSIALSFHRGASKVCVCLNERVPDPYNSTIFKMMKYQMTDPLAWICTPICEPHPTISFLEVVANQRPRCGKDSHPESQTTKPASTSGQRDQTHRCAREEYRKMVDSDEEKGTSGPGYMEDSSDEEEEGVASGYEKHFMPTSVEILEA
ncbi:interleukin-6 receptor subunit beta-like isoform X2 [Dunckerocampus dactyliophorus]|uniref:interleukin-6 receptor subunit beta-like isoform X2 n=1 Tax=Dunckerocampus dactyliophorus TaxID=161453 RepID=UPI00240574A9|nr:interleukin-6 receptor subunit beta-like isoform X2 [Dunckerocampus dactyliophorus]